ncbi:MAG TPA: hydroxysqualene dehydroxylase HpnE [Burkholderiales bacterium]|nr:hydroxysqualene dehydroxylase HpnE [Burkholderiales bacterium]
MDRVADLAHGVRREARSTTRVAVIGGGYAGMAAATELAHRDIPVTVFETARTLGGRARRVEINGVPLDNGLHILIGAYRDTLRLIELTRRPQEAAGLVRLPLELIVHPHFHLRAPRLPAPLHLATALICARGLDLAARLKAAAFIAAMRRRSFRLETDTSVEHLLASYRQPPAVIRYLWNPLCISALNTQPREASAQILLNVLRDSFNGKRSDGDLLLPTMDFSALFPERAAAFLPAHGGNVQLGVTVEALHRTPDGFDLAVDSRHFSHVILAVSPHRLGALIAPHPELAEINNLVRAFSYQPIYSVFLQYAPGTRLPFRMGGIEATYSQWLFDRGRLSGQDGLFGVVISASGAHQEIEQDELARRVHTELSLHFPGLGEPLWHRVIAEKRATFTCSVGLRRPTNRTPIPRLYLAGDYTASGYPATLEAAVRSGIACAKFVAEEVRGDR